MNHYRAIARDELIHTREFWKKFKEDELPFLKFLPVMGVGIYAFGLAVIYVISLFLSFSVKDAMPLWRVFVGIIIAWDLLRMVAKVIYYELICRVLRLLPKSISNLSNKVFKATIVPVALLFVGVHSTGVYDSDYSEAIMAYAERNPGGFLLVLLALGVGMKTQFWNQRKSGLAKRESKVNENETHTVYFNEAQRSRLTKILPYSQTFHELETKVNQVICDYGKTLADGNPVQNIAVLPYPKAVIRAALKVKYGGYVPLEEASDQRDTLELYYNLLSYFQDITREESKQYMTLMRRGEVSDGLAAYLELASREREIYEAELRRFADSVSHYVSEENEMNDLSDVLNYHMFVFTVHADEARIILDTETL